MCCLLDSRTCSFLFLSVEGQLFCSLRHTHKRSFSSACVYSTTRAICLAISSNSFFKSGKSEFLRKSQLKSTRAKREREREREEEERDPRSSNFSTYSIKWWQQLSRNARFPELFTQQVRAPTVSGSAAEAKRRSIYFFRDICRVSAFLFFLSVSPVKITQQRGFWVPLFFRLLRPMTTQVLLRSSSRFYTNAVILLHLPTITS